MATANCKGGTSDYTPLSGSQAGSHENHLSQKPYVSLLSGLKEPEFWNWKSKKGRQLLFSFWLVCFLFFFSSIVFFLSTVFPITQRSHHGESEINSFPKCCLKEATLLTNQTSPRTDWSLLLFPTSTKDQQAQLKHQKCNVHWALAW